MKINQLYKIPLLSLIIILYLHSLLIADNPKKYLGEWRVKKATINGKYLDAPLDLKIMKNKKLLLANRFKGRYYQSGGNWKVKIMGSNGTTWLNGSIQFYSNKVLIKGKNTTNNYIQMLFYRKTGNEGLPRYMRYSGWKSFQEICKTSKQAGLKDFKNTDCEQGTPVTEKSFFQTIYWAGEVVKFYFDKESNSLTKAKIQITWRSPDAKYFCGQIITKKTNKITDFKARSWALKKCE